MDMSTINFKMDKSFESEQGSSRSTSSNHDFDQDPLLTKFHNPHFFTSQNSMDFKTFTQAQKNSSQELYAFLPENGVLPNSAAAHPVTTLTPISENTFIDENSCNAVDIPLAGQANEIRSILTIQQDMSQFFSFNGQFQQQRENQPAVEATSKPEENAVDFLLNISAEAPENTFVDQMTEDEGDGGGKVILSAAKKVTFEQSMMSPDLFEDDDEDDQVGEKFPMPPTSTTEEPELNESAEVEDSKYIQKREKQVYKRIKSSLSGVIPPPSVINANSNLLEAIYSNRTTILESFEKLRSGETVAPFEGEALFKPSHTEEQIYELEWKDIQHVNYHGIHYNVSDISEKIESLTLQIIDRYVSCETASSYQPLPSSAKKRNERLKKLTQSPGSRLSHLAKRRSVFSSVNLQSKADTSLNSSRQILLDNKKSKRKGTTPKRSTPSKNKLIRKTPSSSARKRLFFRTETQIQSKPGPSRETSKRALFQSPAKSLLSSQSKKTVVQQPIKSEFVNRLEKSRRALFSPDKSQDSNSVSSFTFSQPQTKHSLLRSDSRSSISSSIDSLTKRKRDDDGFSNSSKFFRTTSSSNLNDAERITPRSLKIKSQSFSVNADMDKNSSLLRTVSASTIGSSHLSENHRKKLLWAVSQALNSKQISVSNPKFKPFATTLARSLKSVFLEYYHKNCTSTSETMLKLAKKYVYLAISGKSSDDIYLLAKNEIEAKKKPSRISGYIAKEDYENKILRNSQPLKTENSVDSFSFSQFSQSESQDNNSSAIKRLSSQNIHNSSSKNNITSTALRENMDSNSAGKMSAQKNFTGRDQSNISPYNSVEKNQNKSGRKTGLTAGGFSVNSCGISTPNTFKVKRQISFDN